MSCRVRTAMSVRKSGSLALRLAKAWHSDSVWQERHVQREFVLSSLLSSCPRQKHGQQGKAKSISERTTALYPPGNIPRSNEAPGLPEAGHSEHYR
eukprot:scaffold175_cov414-Prasinococcus_capsulatus_cf.AAC.35